jgi:transcription factor CP2-like protein
MSAGYPVTSALNAFGHAGLVSSTPAQPPTPEDSPNLAISNYVAASYAASANAIQPAISVPLVPNLEQSPPTGFGAGLPLMTSDSVALPTTAVSTPAAAAAAIAAVMAVTSPGQSPEWHDRTIHASPPQRCLGAKRPRSLTHEMTSSANEMLSVLSLPQLGKSRFSTIMDAPTAAAQRVEQGTLTYVNKGQFYSITLEDSLKQDCIIETTLRIMFHEKAHRHLASTYWSYWLSQQASPHTARAIDINMASGVGLVTADGKPIDPKQPADTPDFDRVRFYWIGKRGATVLIRFNCLSTEFSRVKGVKGIPMRVQAESRVVGDAQENAERCIAAIKLFRDKGAERKNKDDKRHREKLMQRVRSKSDGAQHPGVEALPQSLPVTVFTLTTEPLEPAELEKVYPEAVSVRHALLNSEPDAHLQLLDDSQSWLGRKHGKKTSAQIRAERLIIQQSALDVDPTYIPQRRLRPAVLSLYVRLPNEILYRACYLMSLTVDELRLRLCEKLGIKPEEIHEMIRVTPKNIQVQIDNNMMQQIEDEQDMYIELCLNEVGRMQLKLHF